MNKFIILTFMCVAVCISTTTCYNQAEYCAKYPKDFYGCDTALTFRAFGFDDVLNIVTNVITKSPSLGLLDIVKTIVVEVGEKIGPVMSEKLKEGINKYFSTKEELIDGVKNIKYNDGRIDFEMSGGKRSK